jgi:hypothetical protein
MNTSKSGNQNVRMCHSDGKEEMNFKRTLLRLSRDRRKSQRTLLRSLEQEQSLLQLNYSSGQLSVESNLGDSNEFDLPTKQGSAPSTPGGERRHRRKMVSITSSSGGGSDFFSPGGVNENLWSSQSSMPQITK